MKTKHLRSVIIAIALVLAGALGTYLLIGSDEEKTEQNVPVNKIELADKIAVAKLKKDTAEVFRLYYDAAQRGDVESQYHLGVCYYSGEGVELSREESVKWFRKAAEQGYADAQYMCGALSESEEDVAKWYYRAAEQGHTVAQTLLGMCYEEGYGVAQSYDDAEKWYRKAAEQGVEEAKQALEELEDERKSKEEYARTHGTINGHDYVDLGLSVKWATCNVGASSPEGYGDYYAYGETTTKDSYTKENCTNYNIIMVPISGDASYDVACKKWGGTWRLPSIIEFEELVENCTWEWTSQKGINGYKLTSKKNGNSIFLPAAGWRSGTLLRGKGTYGSYRSATPYERGTDHAYNIHFYEGVHGLYWDFRDYGLSVRSVCTVGDDTERLAAEQQRLERERKAKEEAERKRKAMENERQAKEIANKKQNQQTQKTPTNTSIKNNGLLPSKKPMTEERVGVQYKNRNGEIISVTLFFKNKWRLSTYKPGATGSYQYTGETEGNYYVFRKYRFVGNDFTDTEWLNGFFYLAKDWSKVKTDAVVYDIPISAKEFNERNPDMLKFNIPPSGISNQSCGSDYNAGSGGVKNCSFCGGSGKCSSCGGLGYKFNPYSGHDDTCPSCRGFKDCFNCSGTGKQF